MKYLSIFLFALSLILIESNEQVVDPDGELEYFGESTDKCVNSTGASLITIDECKAGKLPDDDKFKCFVTCLLQSHGLLDSEGHLTEIPIPALKENIASCTKSSGSNTCDKGFQIAKCLLDTLHIYDAICTMVLS